MLEAQRQAQQAPAEEAEPKAEQASKGKAPPLAKPKAKPQPQPQAPHPPSPPPPPLVARKSAAAVPAEHPEVEEAQGELKGLSASLAASKGAKARAEAKVSQWQTKLAALWAGGDADRIGMAEATLRKAKEKVAEKEEAIEALHRGMRWTERQLAAVVARVKEEEVDEVVEVDLEAEEMEEEIVKEEAKAKVAEETPAGGGGG